MQMSPLLLRGPGMIEFPVNIGQSPGFLFYKIHIRAKSFSNEDVFTDALFIEKTGWVFTGGLVSNRVFVTAKIECTTTGTW